MLFEMTMSVVCMCITFFPSYNAFATIKSFSVYFFSLYIYIKYNIHSHLQCIISLYKKHMRIQRDEHEFL